MAADREINSQAANFTIFLQSGVTQGTPPPNPEEKPNEERQTLEHFQRLVIPAASSTRGARVTGYAPIATQRDRPRPASFWGTAAVSRTATGDGTPFQRKRSSPSRPVSVRFDLSFLK